MDKQSALTTKTKKQIKDYPDILTVEETSELLGICTKTVYKLIKQGKLQKVKIGRMFRIPKKFLLNYLGIDVDE